MNPFAQVTQDPSKVIKKKLFSNAMKSNWQEVINIYYQNREAHNAKITRSGDTALHIAIGDGQESIVEELVSIVAETPGALETQNELGNTPLHMGAYLGSVRMCRCIAAKDSKLIGMRNNDYETPFFLAALHGRKEAFLCLHSLCREVDKGYRYCRRKDGETILHAAISGEYFVNERGSSPLHILASKPDAFKSGSNIGGFRKLIYHCVWVKKLKPCNNIPSQGRYDEDNAENSQTSVGIIRWLRNITRVSMSHRGQRKDAEDPNGQQLVDEQVGSSKIYGSTRQGPDFFVPKCFRTGLKFILEEVLGYSIQIQKLREEKEKHKWSVQIMEKMLEYSSSELEYEYEGSSHPLAPIEDGEIAPYALGERKIEEFSPETLPDELEPMVDDDRNQLLLADNSLEAQQSNEPEQNQGTIGNEEKDKEMQIEKRETPLLIAAKHGIMEMVEKILEIFPVAIHDINIEGKNIVLLAVENRQPHVYLFLLDWKILKETIFQKRDIDGNSALHLAAMIGDHRPLGVPGPALQMQWEIKWYEFVKNSMPPNFFGRYNMKGQVPSEIFIETHRELVKEASEWLKDTSQSCSVVATLIATVAFATSTTIPGGVKSESGIPALEKEPAFCIFGIASLIALCFSVTSTLMFLAFYSSSYREKDFNKVLPRKLLGGLTSLFVSLASMLVSFCAAHFLIMRDRFKYAAFPVYIVIFLLVTSYAVAQFPWYFDVALTTFRNVPQRSRRRQFS